MKKVREVILPIREEKRKESKEAIYDLLLKKDMTTAEISKELHLPNRFVRDRIQLLKLNCNMIETKCRCGHTPVYKVKK